MMLFAVKTKINDITHYVFAGPFGVIWCPDRRLTTWFRLEDAIKIRREIHSPGKKWIV